MTAPPAQPSQEASCRNEFFDTFSVFSAIRSQITTMSNCCPLMAGFSLARETGEEITRKGEERARLFHRQVRAGASQVEAA